MIYTCTQQVSDCLHEEEISYALDMARRDALSELGRTIVSKVATVTTEHNSGMSAYEVRAQAAAMEVERYTNMVLRLRQLEDFITYMSLTERFKQFIRGVVNEG